mmetsp:Transcript_11698/g.39970  ORF Transcript_11698/g.39970 Transcript_11698/m.39970 type:complete len:274 (+) Transcript_11698:41-862(+)
MRPSAAILAVHALAATAPLRPAALPRPRLRAAIRLRAGASASPQPPRVELFTSDMCPYAQRVWICLEELGEPYAKRHIDLRDKPAWYTQEVHPEGKVPAVRLGDRVVVESLAINRALTDRAGERGFVLAGAGEQERARVEEWNRHLDERLNPAFFTLLMHKGDGGSPSPEDARAALDAALRRYEDDLEGPFLLGEPFTLADVAAAPFFERMDVALRHFKGADPLEAFPRTRAWFERVMARPSVAATRRPEDALIALYERFIQANYAFGGLNRN